ncbi:MAG: hypothetical protein SGARI_003008 [Bacillariaceae sp.]
MDPSCIEGLVGASSYDPGIMYDSEYEDDMMVNMVEDEDEEVGIVSSGAVGKQRTSDQFSPNRKVRDPAQDSNVSTKLKGLMDSLSPTKTQGSKTQAIPSSAVPFDATKEDDTNEDEDDTNEDDTESYTDEKRFERLVECAKELRQLKLRLHASFAGQYKSIEDLVAANGLESVCAKAHAIVCELKDDFETFERIDSELASLVDKGKLSVFDSEFIVGVADYLYPHPDWEDDLLVPRSQLANMVRFRLLRGDTRNVMDLIREGTKGRLLESFFFCRDCEEGLYDVLRVNAKKHMNLLEGLEDFRSDVEEEAVAIERKIRFIKELFKKYDVLLSSEFFVEGVNSIEELMEYRIDVYTYHPNGPTCLDGLTKDLLASIKKNKNAVVSLTGQDQVRSADGGSLDSAKLTSKSPLKKAAGVISSAVKSGMKKVSPKRLFGSKPGDAPLPQGHFSRLTVDDIPVGATVYHRGVEEAEVLKTHHGKDSAKILVKKGAKKAVSVPPYKVTMSKMETTG